MVVGDQFDVPNALPSVMLSLVSAGQKVGVDTVATTQIPVAFRDSNPDIQAII
jgi:hypothetical protein